MSIDHILINTSPGETRVALMAGERLIEVLVERLGGGSLVGWGSFALSGSDLFPDPTGGLTPATDFFFQAMFAATAVTIASGAMAERTKFSTYLVFSVFATALIYPIVVHWTWGGGFITDINIGDAVYSDFAGSTIVHSVGGWAALVDAWSTNREICT